MAINRKLLSVYFRKVQIFNSTPKIPLMECAISWVEILNIHKPSGQLRFGKLVRE
jgi:hypothetical protein